MRVLKQQLNGLLKIINKPNIHNILSQTLLFLIPATFLLTLYESIEYYGITEKFIFIDIKIIIVIIIFAISLIKKYDENWKALFLINKIIIFPFILFAFLTLNYVDLLNYVGYVYSIYHIHPQSLILITIFSLGLLIISSNTKRKEIFKNNRSNTVILLALIYANISVAINSTWILSGTFNLVVREDLRTYDARMRGVWGEFYDYMKFLTEEIDEPSTIAHPPQENPWQMEGNQLVSRYFLYPRKLISTNTDNFIESINKSDYIMITNGTPRFYPADIEGWPIMPVPIKKIVLLNKNEVWVKPNSIRLSREGSSESISLEHISKLEISSNTVTEKTIKVIENIPSDTYSVELNLSASENYIASIYMELESSEGRVRYESSSNYNELINSTEMDQDKEEVNSLEYNINLDFSKIPSTYKKTADIYLKITTSQPLPYLHGKGYAEITKSQSIKPTVIDAKYYSDLGNYYYYQNMYDDAEYFYNLGLSIKPDNAESLLGLFYIHNSRREFNQALSNARILKEILPKSDKLNIGTYFLKRMEAQDNVVTSSN